MPNLDLKGDTICTLLYSVILKAPALNDEYPSSGSEQIANKSPRLHSGTKSILSEFSGCYKCLRVLNLSGNNLNTTHLDASTFFSIFDFLENLEDLNIECLKFQSFKIFKSQFLVDFVSNQDYKPYMNTLKRINFNIGSKELYENDMKMSFKTAKTILD